MIFCKVDVTLPDHERVLRIPIGFRSECLGTWLVALCYTRARMLDGFAPFEALERCGASKDVVQRLVDVGLFAYDEKDGMHGIMVLRYADHNETKAKIQQRLRADRARKKPGSLPSGRQTDSKRNPRGWSTITPESDSASSEGIPSGIQTDSKRNDAGFPDSDSLSGSDLSEGEREREQTSGTHAVGGMTACPDELPIDDDLRAQAAMAGWPKPDDEWPKFRSDRRAKGLVRADWREDFKFWLQRGKQFAERDRAKARAAATTERPSGPVPHDPNSPAIVAERKRREASMREAEANRADMPESLRSMLNLKKEAG